MLHLPILRWGVLHTRRLPRQRKQWMNRFHRSMVVLYRTVANFDRSVGQIKAELAVFQDFFRPQKETSIRYLKSLLKFVIIPSLCVASLLFYAFENPPTGKMSPNDIAIGKQKASLSWWVIFLGVRHPLVWSFARVFEFAFSGFFGVASPRFAKLVGPRAGMLFAQSRGWPCVLIFYGILCFVLLYGKTAHAAHWLFWCVVFMRNVSLR